MKELHGRAVEAYSAPQSQTLELLRAVDRYPHWYPEVVREVEVIERDGAGDPSVVRATLHVAVGPLSQDVHVLMRVSGDDSAVTLTRIAHEPSDPEEFMVRWELGPEQLAVDLVARLDVPRLVPLGGIGDSMAAGFVRAATAELSRLGR